MPDLNSTPSEAPDADVLEQRTSVSGEPDDATPPLVTRDPEAPEADAYEQALDVPIDDDEDR